MNAQYERPFGIIVVPEIWKYICQIPKIIGIMTSLQFVIIGIILACSINKLLDILPRKAGRRCKPVLYSADIGDHPVIMEENCPTSAVVPTTSAMLHRELVKYSERFTKHRMYFVNLDRSPKSRGFMDLSSTGP